MIDAPYVYEQVVSLEEKEPVVIAIGGGPGSGKTTLRRQMQKGLPTYFVHDMDEVMLAMPEYIADVSVLGHKEAFLKWWPAAREKAEASVREAIESGMCILYDRTCGTEGSYFDLLHAKKLGYTVQLIGMTVDLPIAKNRAFARVKSEGRMITEEIIDEYHRRFRALWPKYLEFVDSAHLYDTTFDPPKLIFSKIEGVLDHAAYQRFLEGS